MFKLFKYVKKIWWQFLLVFIFVAVSSYLQLQIPAYMGDISKELTLFNQKIITDPNIYDVAHQEMMSNIWKLGIEMLLYTVAGLLVSIMVPFFNTLAATTFGREIRKAIFKKTQDLSLDDYNKIGAAGLLTRLTSDTNNVKMLVQMGSRIIIQSPIMIVIAIIQVSDLKASSSYFWLLVIGLLIIGVTMGIIFSKVVPKFTLIQERVDKTTLLFRQDLTGVRVVRAFNQEDRENKYFDEASRNLADTIIETGHTISFLNPSINIVFNVMTVAIYIVAFAVLNGKTLDGLDVFAESVAVSQYVSMIMMSFLMMAMLFFQLPRAQASARRINEVLDMPSSMVSPENPMVPLADHYGHIEFQNVSFQFPDATKPTLIDINFDVKPGQTIAIIGTTGSGKSSIINLIPRFYDVSTGSVIIDGQDVRAYDLLDLRDKVGFVPQTATLFSGTIASNLKFGKPDATEEDMWEALEIAQAADFVKELPLQLEAPVARSGKNFSGGQKQRLAIARALIKKPEIYIFDDSFSALDFKTDIRLRSALKKITSESAVVIVGQRVSSIMDADEILVLDNGAIVGQGTHDELIKTSAVYQEIVLSQLDADEIEKTNALRSEIISEGGNA